MGAYTEMGVYSREHGTCIYSVYLTLLRPFPALSAPSAGVSCDACGKGGFPGKRYKCLVCYDFDLCADCYESGETGTGRHSTLHPMQCILTRVDSGGWGEGLVGEGGEGKDMMED